MDEHTCDAFMETLRIALINLKASFPTPFLLRATQTRKASEAVLRCASRGQSRPHPLTPNKGRLVLEHASVLSQND